MNKTKIYITFDYELFFGPSIGSVSACMLEPTQRLMEISQKYGVCFTFFVDAGMLCAFRDRKDQYPELAQLYKVITRQIQEIESLGHSIQLHVHPHWEDTKYDGETWQFEMTRYRLASFSSEEADAIIRRYHKELQQHLKTQMTAFRAGGWCIQPFALFRKTFADLGICVDSSLFRDGYMQTETHQFDFRGMPKASCWTFDQDPMVPVPNGQFTEIPIAMTRYSRCFYAGMLVHRLCRTEKYKISGDGRPIGGGRKRQLLSVLYGDNDVVTLDTYRCNRVESALQEFVCTDPDGHFVVIAHPKALTEVSFQVLNHLAKSYTSNFTTF